jgi:hypothetical protein
MRKQPNRRRPTLQQQLPRISLSSWLWLAAAILAVILVVLYFA